MHIRFRGLVRSEKRPSSSVFFLFSEQKEIVHLGKINGFKLCYHIINSSVEVVIVPLRVPLHSYRPRGVEQYRSSLRVITFQLTKQKCPSTYILTVRFTDIGKFIQSNLPILKGHYDRNKSCRDPMENLNKSENIPSFLRHTIMKHQHRSKTMFHLLWTKPVVDRNQLLS